MKLFDKFFSNKTKQASPDNFRLNQLLDIYVKENGKGDSYRNVVMELMNGNSSLLLPSKNDTAGDNQWITAKTDTTLNLTCVFDQDGLKVLGAFTDEEALLRWTKGQPSQYTQMRSQDILKFCQTNGINRIVINSDTPSMFVLERNKEHVREHQIYQDTQVQIGSPSQPLSNSIIQKLIDNFKNDSTISEVYQYGQTKEGEFSIVLGFKLDTYSHNAKTAAINAAQNALQNQNLDQPLDLFFIETEDWYNMIKGVQNSLVYKRE